MQKANGQCLMHSSNLKISTSALTLPPRRCIATREMVLCCALNQWWWTHPLRIRLALLLPCVLEVSAACSSSIENVLLRSTLHLWFRWVAEWRYSLQSGLRSLALFVVSLPGVLSTSSCAWGGWRYFVAVTLGRCFCVAFITKADSAASCAGPYYPKRGFGSL